MRKLFICYYSGDRAEVDLLTQELRARGIAVWLDHDRGFKAGDNTQWEARRVLADPQETFGLLLYASPAALERPFIRQVELHEALQRKERDQTFLLMTVPRGMDFPQLARHCLSVIGEDITVFHSSAIYEPGTGMSPAPPLQRQYANLATMMLSHRLQTVALGTDGFLGINFCTREHIPPSIDDVLDIDATTLVCTGSQGNEEWHRLVPPLRDIKRSVRANLGLVRLRVRGSKHLSAAFLLGRLFPPSTVKEIQVQQGDTLWSTACPSVLGSPLMVDLVAGTVGSQALFVELSTTEKSIRSAVRRYIQSTGVAPLAYLRMQPTGGLRYGAVTDNATACAIALQVRIEIAKTVEQYDIQEIHLFAAIPQGLMLMLGYHLNATVPVQLYEYDGEQYRPSLRLCTSDLA